MQRAPVTWLLRSAPLLAAALLAACSASPSAGDGSPPVPSDATVDQRGGEAGRPRADGAPDRGGIAGPRTFTISVVDDAPKFKSRAALAVGPDNSRRVAYNVASDPEGWHQPDVWFANQPEGGRFAQQRVAAADGRSNEFPVLLVDGQGATHIFYNRYDEAADNIELFHVRSTDQQSFSAPENLTGTADVDEFATAVARGAAGDLHLLFRRHPKDAAKTIGYLRIVGGKPQPVEVVADPAADMALDPDHALAVAPDGVVHAVYALPGSAQFNAVLWLRRRADSWGEPSRVTPEDADAWGPAIALDGSGAAHVTCGLGPSWDAKTLTYYRIVDGQVAAEETLSTSIAERTYYLGLAAEPDGTVHIAFTRFFEVDKANHGDVFYISGQGGAFSPEQRVTDTPDLDEDAPAIAVGKNGEVLISFIENLSQAPAGKVYLAEGK